MIRFSDFSNIEKVCKFKNLNFLFRAGTLLALVINDVIEEIDHEQQSIWEDTYGLYKDDDE